MAIIPARGGSKRIPRKNIRAFGGKPMIAWSIEAALQSGVFDQVIVSTDCPEIAEVSRAHGAQVPFLRPEEHAGDTSALMPVLRLHLDALAREGKPASYAFCIYATAPFLQPSRLAEAATMLWQSSADFVLAVSPFEYPVQRCLKLGETGRLSFAHPEFALTHSQQLEPRFHDAGQFFGGRAEAVRTHDAVLFADCLPLSVPRDEAVDIDTPDDWRFAEALRQVRTLLQA